MVDYGWGVIARNHVAYVALFYRIVIATRLRTIQEEGRRREGGGKEEGRRRKGGGKEEGRRRGGGEE